MSRPGRPRKTGKRQANGRLVREREVGPTREQAIRRQALAGVRGDPTKTSSPLDFMLLHGVAGAEYRRYRRTFNERVFYIGRPVAFAYRRDRAGPRLTGVVTSFATVPVSEMPEMLDIYPDMAAHAPIAAIGVDLDCWRSQ